MEVANLLHRHLRLQGHQKLACRDEMVDWTTWGRLFVGFLEAFRRLGVGLARHVGPLDNLVVRLMPNTCTPASVSQLKCELPWSITLSHSAGGIHSCPLAGRS